MLVSSKGTEEELKEALSCGVDDIRIPQAGNAKVSAEAEQEYSQKWNILLPDSVISVNEGEKNGSILVVAPKRKDRTIDLTILHEKKKWWFSEELETISCQGEDVNLDNEKQLKKYGISVRNVAK